MTLYLIGIGLNDEKDITVKGLECVRRCRSVYLETYTSALKVSLAKLEEFYQKKIIPADRVMVEQDAEQTILHDARTSDAALLVIGDPFGATTHISLYLAAKNLGIPIVIINNASILNAVGIVGLELYKFGKVTSIPFENKKVTTPYEVFQSNDASGLHTLVLFDLDPGNDRFMTVREAVSFFIARGMDQARLCVGLAGIGSPDPEIVALPAERLQSQEFHSFPQCLIIPSKLHFIEEEALGRKR